MDQDLTKEIKESLQAIRDEFIRDEKADAWKKAASITIVLIAVCAALASQRANRYGENVLSSLNDSNLQQSLAANQWSYFQSKSIKSHLYEIDREKIPADNVDLLAQTDATIARYDGEKDEIMATARGHEEERKAFRKVATTWSTKAAAMGLAVSIFSIAIAVGSVTLLIEKKYLWYLTILLGVIGIAQMIRAAYFIVVEGPAVL